MAHGRRDGNPVRAAVLMLMLLLPLRAAAGPTPPPASGLPALLAGLRMARESWWNQADVVKALQLKDEQRAALDKLLAQAQEGQRAITLKQTEQLKALEEALASADWDGARKAGDELRQGSAAASMGETTLKIGALKLLDDTQRQTLAAHYAHVLRRPWLIGLPMGGIHLEGKGRPPEPTPTR